MVYGNPELTLAPDTANEFLWDSSSTVRGNLQSFTLSGSCVGGMESVRLSVDGQDWLTVSCEGERFSLPLTGAKSLGENGTYQFVLQGLSSRGVLGTLTKTYVLKRVADPETLLSFDFFASTSIYETETLSGSCAERLSITVAGQTVSCNANSSFSVPVNLAMGAQSVAVNWVDDYRNTGSRTFSITRNEPGTPFLTAGMVSATAATPIALENITSGNPALAPSLELASVLGTSGGAASLQIPLALAPVDPATGLQLNLGNESYLFCLTQNEQGECIP